MMKQYGSEEPIDFLMYIGDESENELAFTWLNQLNR
jgi:hypothetical protein